MQSFAHCFMPMDMKNRPNDILALEYMKENRAQDAGLEEFTVPRFGAGHDSSQIVQKTASASFIRKMLTDEEKNAEMAEFMPSEAFEILRSSDLCGKEAQDRWFDIIRWCIVDKTPNLKTIYQNIRKEGHNG